MLMQMRRIVTHEGAFLSAEDMKAFIETRIARLSQDMVSATNDPAMPELMKEILKITMEHTIADLNAIVSNLEGSMKNIEPKSDPSNPFQMN
jgi:hypothetical protein